MSAKRQRGASCINSSGLPDIAELKSQNCETPSKISFINRSHRPARLFWIDFKGQLVQYAVLKSSKPFDIQTFVTHPWLCCDAENDNILFTGGNQIYLPEAWDGGPVKPVFIDLPVCTLRERCLQAVRTIYGKQLHEILEHMDIPHVLKEDLIHQEKLLYQIRIGVRM